MDVEFYKNTINKSPFGYSYHKIILNNSNEAIDYIFLEVNSAFENLTGLKAENIINHSVLEVIPNLKNDPFDWIKIYGEIAINGGQYEFEQYSHELERWYKVHAYSPEKYYFITIFIDITNEIKNNAELESFFSLNPDLLCIIDLTGKFLKANQAWEKVLGYKSDEIVNHAYTDFIHPDDINQTISAFEKLNTQTKIQNFVNRYISKTGDIIYLEWGAQLAGNIIYAATRDITEEIQITENLKKSQEQYMLAVNGSNDGIWDWNLIDNSLFLSSKWKNIIGYEDEELPNHYNSFEENLHNDDKELVFRVLQDYLDKKISVYNVEFRMRHKDGSYRWILARGETLRDKNDKAYRMAGSHTDITDRKIIEESLRQSHQTYIGILDSISDAIYVHNSDGKFVYINKAAENFYGYQRNEIIGNTPEFLSAEGKNDIDEINVKIKKAFNGEPQEFEFWGKRKDGSIFPKEVSVNPGTYFDSPAIISVARNITERKRIENEHNESEKKYRLITENADDVIWILDLNRKFTFISPSIFKLRGLTVEEAIQENIADTLPPKWSYKVSHEIENGLKILRETGRYPSAIFEIEQYKKDGSTIWVEINVNGLYNEINELVGIIGVSRNIDKRKKVEEKLIRYAEELEIINKEKDKFFSIIAHDLKAPFSGFLGLTKILATQIQDLKIKEMQEFGINMRNSANNLYKLLENLLQWANMKRGTSDFKSVEFQLDELVKSNIELFKNNFKEKEIKIINNITNQISVFADMAMIDTVIRNLLSNAVKYSNIGGLIQIGINNSNSKNNKVCIFIKDDGIGMDKDLQSKLFKIDVKVTRFGTNEESGTGLGLLLCKEFIRINSGELWFESQVNKGSTFYFTINLLKTEL